VNKECCPESSYGLQIFMLRDFSLLAGAKPMPLYNAVLAGDNCTHLHVPVQIFLA
jgi:hypothetical protein